MEAVFGMVMVIVVADMWFKYKTKCRAGIGDEELTRLQAQLRKIEQRLTNLETIVIRESERFTESKEEVLK